MTFDPTLDSRKASKNGPADWLGSGSGGPLGWRSVLVVDGISRLSLYLVGFSTQDYFTAMPRSGYVLEEMEVWLSFKYV
jgi:hypothetical protein